MTIEKRILHYSSKELIVEEAASKIVTDYLEHKLPSDYLDKFGRELGL